MKKYKLLTFFLLLLVTSCAKQKDPFLQFENTMTPQILGKGSLSLDSVQWNNVYVSKTQELYFTKMGKSGSIIHKMDYVNGTFENLKAVAFPEGSPHSDIYVNNEGNTMLFSSLMKETESDTISDWNIWSSKRKNGIWQSPTPFFDQNIEGNQFYPWLTNSGNLYFAITPHGSENSDLYVSEYKNGIYQSPKKLPTSINSKNLEGDAFVAPDESYLIFAGFDRDQNLGRSDLYISFNSDSNWSSPIWLGKEINSEGYDGSPFVSRDGKYLIFTSSRGSNDDDTYFNHYILAFDPSRFK